MPTKVGSLRLCAASDHHGNRTHPAATPSQSTDAARFGQLGAPVKVQLDVLELPEEPEDSRPSHVQVEADAHEGGLGDVRVFAALVLGSEQHVFEFEKPAPEE